MLLHFNHSTMLLCINDYPGSWWAYVCLSIVSLVPRLLQGRKVEPGTHCLRMCKNLRKRVSKRIRE